MRTLAIVALAACATPHVPRFANAPPVWVVNDRSDVPVAPSVRVYHRMSYHFDSYYLSAVRSLAVPAPRRALGINALDEVPDSTWFTNRIGTRELTPDAIRRGPRPDSPETYLPWTIKKSKSGGTDPGFLVEDSRGKMFLLKFDRKGVPEAETAADAISARLLWAAGYNVPADHVVYVERKDLRIARDAYTKVGDVKRPIDEAFIDRELARVEPAHDGKLRGIASMYLTGKMLGGAPRIGVRADDPNDLIPHEQRRDQRGLAVFLAWLSHTDMKEDNTVDAWQQDPADLRVHYVVHYLVDFGWTLGVDALASNEPYVDYRYGIDPAATLRSIATLGLEREPWEGRSRPPIRGIALYSADNYDPAAWKPGMPSQLPAIWADRFDKLWGSKILIRFTRDQLAAAVAAGRFSDPRAAEYMVDTLIARQRITARHWFRKTSPIDDIAVIDDRLCFTDLALHYRLDSAETRFTVTTTDAAGIRVGDRETVTPDRNGRACAALRLAGDRDRYTIVRIDSSRTPGIAIHLAGDRARVIGLQRD